MSVPTVNLRIDKGTDFESTFDLTNADGTVFSINYTASAKIRKHHTVMSIISTTITGTGKDKIMTDTQTAALRIEDKFMMLLLRMVVGKKLKSLKEL